LGCFICLIYYTFSFSSCFIRLRKSNEITYFHVYNENNNELV